MYDSTFEARFQPDSTTVRFLTDFLQASKREKFDVVASVVLVD